MPTIAISIPSGSHHRALLQPLRDFLIARKDWKYLILSPGAPWANELFPAALYPRDQFSFAEIKAEQFAAPETKEMLRALYEREKPALVVTTTTGRDPVDRPILSVAKERSIRTCTFVESWDNIWKMARKREEQVIPDRLIVWNRIMKDHALREFPELTADRVSVTGSPRLDLAKRGDLLPSRETVFRTLGLDPNKRLLHLSTVELYDMSHVAHEIARAYRQGELPKDLQLLATVHPGGNFARHQAWAEPDGYFLRHTPGRHESGPHKDFLYNPTVEENALLMGLFREEDVLINFSSTVALEAMLMDTPTIGVKYGKPLDWWNWRRSAVVRDLNEHYQDLVRDGGIRVVAHRRDLVPAINQYLEHPEYDREERRLGCERLMTTLTGDATKKTFDVIASLVR